MIRLLLIFSILFTTLAIGQVSYNQIGISISDSLYFKPDREPGDVNLGISYNRVLNKVLKGEVIGSYAFEGLNEIWLQSKLHYQFNNEHKYSPYLTGGLIYQHQPEKNFGGSLGLGIDTSLYSLSPFLRLRMSSNMISMFNDPNDFLWEVIRVDLLMFM